MPSTIVFITTTLLVSYFIWYFSTNADRYPSCCCRAHCSSPRVQSNPEVSADYRPSELRVWDERTRYATSYRPRSTTIFSFPKKGSVYILQNALTPEFEFLGLDRFVFLRSGGMNLDHLNKTSQSNPLMRKRYSAISVSVTKEYCEVIFVLCMVY
jgi:hypothetical protein